MFGNADGNMINPPNPNRSYWLRTAEIGIPNQEALHLFWDLEIILGMAKDLPGDSQAAADALYTANAIVNVVHADDPDTVAKGRQISQDFFKKRSEYGYADHEVVATGHCHIDTAWLWPFDETKRKAARSWASQCTLMDEYPEV